MTQKQTRNLVYALFGIAIICVLSVPSALIQWRIEQQQIVVESKERLLDVSSNSEGSTTTKYVNFVYSPNETYVVKDSFWNWHFRARTVYAQIPDQGSCDVTLSGVRWGFLSMHQNIIAAECDQSS